MRSQFRAAGLLAVAMVSGVAVVAGCSSGSPTPAPTVTVTHTQSAPATGTSTGSPTASAAVAGPDSCQSGDLRVTLGSGNAAAGTNEVPIEFTNVSGASCTLYGFPGISFTGETSAVQVGPAATRNLSITPHLVTLAPGAVGSALISIVDAQNYPAGSCGLTTASGILVYPPNLRTAVSLDYNGYTCVHAKDHVLTVDPVVAGSGT
jgi:hypothetical protein